MCCCCCYCLYRDRSGGQAEFFPLLEGALADRAWIPKPTAAKAPSIQLFEFRSFFFYAFNHAIIGSSKERDEGRNHWDPEEHVKEEQGGPGQHLQGVPGPRRSDQHGQANGGALQEYLN